MNRIPLIAICCLAAVRMNAADGMVRLFPEPGGKVSVSGENTLHTWVIRGSKIGGWIEFPPGVFDRSGETLALGRAAARYELTIPVSSLSSYGGLTEWMHQLLKDAAYPQITFSVQETCLQAARVGRETVYHLDAQGRLAIAGVTNNLAILIDVFPLGEQRFRLTGKKALKMSNHSIKPPVLQTSGGDVKYRDDVDVLFELIVGPKRRGGEID